MAPNIPTWPAMLQFAHAAELSYLADEHSWQAFIKQPNHWHAEDRVIDSTGAVFQIVLEEKRPTLNHLGTHLPLETLVELLQMHLAEQGQCCVTKAGADSIEDVLTQLASVSV